uniref:Uncharacterized protein n=1 Tax=Aegilops tauschii subsp. strangulata TaxID=200361 RepID=A0A453DBR9_AEGTS
MQMQAGYKNVRRSADDARVGVLLGVDDVAVARLRVVRRRVPVRRVARLAHWDGRARALRVVDLLVPAALIVLLPLLLGRADGDHPHRAEALAQLVDDVDGVDRPHDRHLAVLHVHDDLVDTTESGDGLDRLLLLPVAVQFQLHHDLPSWRPSILHEFGRGCDRMKRARAVSSLPATMELYIWVGVASDRPWRVYRQRPWHVVLFRVLLGAG